MLQQVNKEAYESKLLLYCTFLNQHLIEINQQPLRIALLKRYFETICRCNFGIFIASVMNLDPNFFGYLKQLEEDARLMIREEKELDRKMVPI